MRSNACFMNELKFFARSSNGSFTSLTSLGVEISSLHFSCCCDMLSIYAELGNSSSNEQEQETIENKISKETFNFPFYQHFKQIEKDGDMLLRPLFDISPITLEKGIFLMIDALHWNSLWLITAEQTNMYHCLQLRILETIVILHFQ